VAFEGIKLRLLNSGLTQEDFVTLGAGQTKEITVETAALHELKEGGEFDVFAKGVLPYAEESSTELTGSLDYESNKLTMNIDGAQAATVAKAIVKRTAVGSSCTGSKLTAVRTALSNCARLATAAAGATSGTRYTTYFKTASATTVAARLRAVSSDCSSTSSRTTTNCKLLDKNTNPCPVRKWSNMWAGNDPYGGCSSNVLAYTVPSANFITYCPLFFSALPALSGTCHAQDQATTVIHEETHAPGVYSPGTDDLGYGYAAATALSANSALNNADSYALFANGKRIAF
jgi:deuterolysin